MRLKDGVMHCSTKFLRALVGSPCVYIFWKGKNALYVGSSSEGLYRPLQRTHSTARRCIRVGDRLEMYLFKTMQEALEYEDSEIRRLQPVYNSIAQTGHLAQVLKAIDGGEFDSNIARSFGLSRQRIHQIRKKYRNSKY